MKASILSAALLFALQTTTAFAQSKDQADMCKKVKNAGHRAACMCHISNGGVVEPRAGGGYRWSTRGGGGNMALQNCLAKI
jgi:hypothetical protein